jgi:hypothetical protein
MENHRLQQALRDGIKIPEDGDWGNVPSKICGEYGGATEDVIGSNTIKDFGSSFVDKREKNGN